MMPSDDMATQGVMVLAGMHGNDLTGMGNYVLAPEVLNVLTIAIFISFQTYYFVAISTITYVFQQFQRTDHATVTRWRSCNSNIENVAKNFKAFKAPTESAYYKYEIPTLLLLQQVFPNIQHSIM